MPPAGAAAEPFSGAEAALVPIGTRGCLVETGPAVGPMGTRSRPSVDAWLGARGYVAATPGWSGGSPAPVDLAPPELAGSCGVIAFSAVDPSATITGYVGSDGRLRTPCLPDLAIVPACDGDRVRAEGSGALRYRVFLMPGLTPRAVAESEMSAAVVLAHAEAEAQLRAIGWMPSDEVVRVVVPPGSASTTHTPPMHPTSGCIGWIVASEELGTATTQWAHRPIDGDASPHELTAGAVSCAPDPSAPATETTLTVYDSDGGGGALFFRPYAPARGPMVAGHGEARALSAAAMRMTTSPPRTLPRAVPMNPAPE